MLLDTWANVRARAEKVLTPGQRWTLAKQQALRNLEKFDPNEPRDESGKWTDGGGSDGGGTKPSAEPKPEAETHEQKVERIVASVPGAKEKIDELAAKVAQGKSTDSPTNEGGYKMSNGHYAPDRAKAHAEIFEKIFTPQAIAAATPKPGEKPVVHLLGGAGGSGKSWFTGPEGTIKKEGKLYLNSDDIKEMLPGYEGWNAPLMHEESSDAFKMAEKFARGMGLNVIIDGTMGSKKSLEDRITAYKAAGYRVEGHFMRVSPETAATRALQRFVRAKGGKGRFVPPSLLLGHSAVPNFESQRSRMDTSEIYDNEGKHPVFVSRR